ncbi:hypothetical protein AAVH_07784 [Aphelenchoides avenae]|nr:hypothetical protein AAVH_07784 [Aphelenchus avenae]
MAAVQFCRQISGSRLTFALLCLSAFVSYVLGAIDTPYDDAGLAAVDATDGDEAVEAPAKRNYQQIWRHVQMQMPTYMRASPIKRNYQQIWRNVEMQMPVYMRNSIRSRRAPVARASLINRQYRLG